MTDRQRKLLGYIRSSLANPDPSGQRDALLAWADAHGLQVEFFIDHSAPNSTARPALKRAMQKLKTSSEVGGLLVMSLDRIGSVEQVLRLYTDLRVSSKSLIVVRDAVELDPDSDHSGILKALDALSAVGAAIASENTRAALAVARMSGRKLGRPRTVTDEMRAEVLALWRRGVPIREIARRIPNISRGTVQSIVRQNKTKGSV